MAISHTKMHPSLEVTISGRAKLQPPRKPWEINLRPFIEKGWVTSTGFPGGSVIKSLWANAGDTGSVPRSGRPPGEGNGNPLQYSCLGNPMDRGAWQATVHGVVVKNQTRLNDSLTTKVTSVQHQLGNGETLWTEMTEYSYLPLLTWSHYWGAALGMGNQDQAPHLPDNSLYNAWAAGWGITSQAEDGGCNYLPALWSFSQEYLLSLSRVIRTATSSWRRQNSLCTTLPPSLPESRKQGVGRQPLGPISHIGFSALINWLHLPHIWQAGFLITLWSLQRTWITGMRGALVTAPHSLLLKIPHISRGQALAWAGAEPRTGAMASRHCHGAQRFSLRGRRENFKPRQCAAFFSCQSYLVCI